MYEFSFGHSRPEIITRFLVGVDYYDSELWITTVSPSEETWNTADDREIFCLIEGDEATSSYQDSEI